MACDDVAVIGAGAYGLAAARAVTAEPSLLRVALIVEAAVVPGLLAALPARLAATTTVDLEIFTLRQTRLRPPEPFVLRLYRAVDAWFFRSRPDAFARVRIGVDEAMPSRFVGRDVVLDFASSDPRALAHGVRYVVWTLVLGPVTRHGRIACVRLDAGARPIAEPQTVLARPYHLLYPFVFRYRGDIFMIPESRAKDG